jgi:hypothetical protein
MAYPLNPEPAERTGPAHSESDSVGSYGGNCAGRAFLNRENKNRGRTAKALEICSLMVVLKRFLVPPTKRQRPTRRPVG